MTVPLKNDVSNLLLVPNFQNFLRLVLGEPTSHG